MTDGRADVNQIISDVARMALVGPGLVCDAGDDVPRVFGAWSWARNDAG
jgi:hypothetical protein